MMSKNVYFQRTYGNGILCFALDLCALCDLVFFYMSNSQPLSIFDKLRSASNAFWFFIRAHLRLKRRGYSEVSPLETPFVPEAQHFNTKYQFTELGVQLFPRHWIRNLATLWILEQMLEGESWPTPLKVLEPCCQDFVRLPAIARYFLTQNTKPHITGVEIDAFVPLEGFHSRWDHAEYYRSITPAPSEYKAQDFFKFYEPADLIICFYPFISPAPALAWGLPAAVASPQGWVESFLKNLKPGGRVLVVHQGDWEEAEFDKARAGSSLQIIRRKALECPFFPSKHPMHATFYVGD